MKTFDPLLKKSYQFTEYPFRSFFSYFQMYTVLYMCLEQNIILHFII